MEKIAICNVNSYGREFPEFLKELEEEIGPVTKFSFHQDVSSKVLAETLKGYTYVILGTHPTFKREFFEHNSDLKLIARHGLGFNNIDLVAAKEHNVFVTCEEKSIEQDAVSEMAISLLHALSRNIVIANKMVHDGEWNIHRERTMGYQIRNKTTGIIGLGNIGRRVAKIMKYGYGNRIIAYDPFLSKCIVQEGIEFMSFEDILKEADFISLHCNLTPDNKRMINADNIKLMKRSAILLNCARGELIDEKAVAQAVKERKIFGYGADTTVQEPINEDNPLLKLDHVVLSPHIGVYSLECTERMNRKVYEDIKLVHNNKRPKVIINEM